MTGMTEYEAVRSRFEQREAAKAAPQRWDCRAAIDGARLDAAAKAERLARPKADEPIYSRELDDAADRYYRRIGRAYDRTDGGRKCREAIHTRRAARHAAETKDEKTMTTANNIVSLPAQARLPLPAGAAERGISAAMWRVLCETVYPNAKTAEAILMAWDYCFVRRLDIFKKPIHIVPVWNSAQQREVETVWAGINEIQITAARTGAWAGMDAPKWGPAITRTFKGKKKDRNGWRDATETVTFPEWCEVTVYRLVGGQPRAFTERVYWLEAYATTGGRDSELPNDMWLKRVYGQVQKVAKAGALRAAFPEEAEYAAEEMEGRVIEAGGAVIEGEVAEPPKAIEAPKPVKTFTINGVDQEFPRTGRGFLAALEVIESDIPRLVLLNPDFLDRLITAFPDLAERVVELRARASAALTPADTADDEVDLSDLTDEALGIPDFDPETGEIVEDGIAQKIRERRGAAPADSGPAPDDLPV